MFGPKYAVRLNDKEKVFFSLGTLILLILLSVNLTLKKCFLSILRKLRIYHSIFWTPLLKTKQNKTSATTTTTKKKTYDLASEIADH